MRRRGRPDEEPKPGSPSNLRSKDDHQPSSEPGDPPPPRAARPTTRKRLVGVYEVEESVPTLASIIPGISAWQWFDGFCTSLPFLFRLVSELAQGDGWPAIIIWTLTQVGLSLVPALELWLSAQLLGFVEEAISTRTIKDEHRFILIASLRVLCPIGKRILGWCDSRTDNILSARLGQVFSRRILEAQLRLSLGTLSDPDTQRVFQQVGAMTGIGGDSKRRGGGGEFSGIARGLTGLLSVVEMLAQGMILAGMLREKKEDRVYAAVALLGYILSRWESSHIRKGDTWWSQVVNEDYLQMQRLSRIGTSLQFKAEVESLGLEDWVLDDYTKSSRSLGQTSTVHPRKAARQQFSVIGSIRDMLSQFPLIHLAYTSVHSPSTIPLSLATITLVQQTTHRFASKVEQLANLSDGLADEIMNFRNLFELVDMKTDVVSGKVPYESGVGKGMKVEFRDVTFTYTGVPKPSVENISFKLEPGQLAVVVGINGGGKSTMIKLLDRLYDPSSGEVVINDSDARSYRLKDLRAAVAVGWQDYVHFPLTIAENIALGDASAPFSLDAVIAAAKLAGAHDFITSLPSGYSTSLDAPITGFGRLKNRGGVSLQERAKRGEEDKASARELKLSGGQWQKLALSRTMMRARKVDLLVFDEPSSSLDPKAEFELFEQLNELRDGRTSIYISHRFGRFNKEADLVLYIDGGKIIEQGSHAELMLRGGRYEELYAMAASAFIDDAK